MYEEDKDIDYLDYW